MENLLTDILKKKKIGANYLMSYNEKIKNVKDKKICIF